MEYICHRRYKKKGASGKKYDIRRKSRHETAGPFIVNDADAICAISSEDAHRHFARNDDGRGLERGRLSYAIAFAPRSPNDNNSFRFTEAERDMISTEYSKFIIDSDFIIFNDDFFNAKIEELEELYQRLEG